MKARFEKNTVFKNIDRNIVYSDALILCTAFVQVELKNKITSHSLCCSRNIKSILNLIPDIKSLNLKMTNFVKIIFGILLSGNRKDVEFLTFF